MRISLGLKLLRQIASGSTAATSGINAPVLSRTSSAGAAPLTMDVAFDATVFAGFVLHLQIATDSGFASVTQDLTQIIDAASWEAGDMTLAGFSTPSGLYYARCRVETAPGDATYNLVSPWSNTITDTISASAAVLNSATGTNKSKYIDVATPFHQSIMNNNVGNDCLVRATLAAANTKFHAEFTCNHYFASGKFICGFGDATIDFNSGGGGTIANAARPGYTGGNLGITATIDLAETTVDVWANGGVTSPTLTAAFATGDALIWEVDQSTHVVKLYQWRVATSTSALVATITLTSQIPSTWNAFCGGQRGDGTVGNSDAATFNAGGQTNKMTPTAGFGIYA